MALFDPVKLYERIKAGPTKYVEEVHCPTVLSVMSDPDKGTVAEICCTLWISESTFYEWCKKHTVFAQCYSIGKMLARKAWDDRGNELRDYEVPMGTISWSFEHWRMVGWSRFGVGKNSRIRLDLNPSDTPDKHYSQLLEQAAQGEFTAGEIKQLMEAINVGLKTHDVIFLQEQIDELKDDLDTMSKNQNVQNTVPDTRPTQENKDTVANSLRE